MTTYPISGAESRRVLVKALFPCLLLLMIGLPLLTLHLDVYPAVWFDEGYSMHAARTLAERGVYGTYDTGGYRHFDPMITTGPPVVIPIALSFKLLGPGIAQARIVIVLFTLLALFSLYAVAVHVYGRAAGLFITMGLLAVPAVQGVGFLLIGRQVLGEAPSLAMIMLGFWLWFRAWEDKRSDVCSPRSLSVLAGLAFGLGLICKMQVGIALLPTLVLIAAGRGLKDPPRLVKLLVPAAVMLVVGGGWMLFGRLGTPEQIRLENGALSPAP